MAWVQSVEAGRGLGGAGNDGWVRRSTHRGVDAYTDRPRSVMTLAKNLCSGGYWVAITAQPARRPVTLRDARVYGRLGWQNATVPRQGVGQFLGGVPRA